jgi:hypothetical protein
MDRFVRRQNVERYRRLLETVIEESECQRILKLLAQESSESKKTRAILPRNEPGHCADHSRQCVGCMSILTLVSACIQ